MKVCKVDLEIKMASVKNLDPTEITKRFYLDEEGMLCWAVRSGGTGKFRKGDKVLGTVSPAGYTYISITIAGIKYRPKRSWVIWAILNGCWPQGVIDHIDGNPKNDAPSNLRDITQSQNLRNNQLERMGHPVGVYYNSRYKKPYGVQFGVGGKTQYYGRFHTEAEAQRRAEEVREELLA